MSLFWILDHIDDLDADFRVFYRIDGVADGEFGDLSSRRFVALCYRTVNYRGSITAAAVRQIGEQEGEGFDGFEDDEPAEPDWPSEADELAELGLNMETL